METFDRMMEGLEGALAHASGNTVPDMVVHIPAQLDVGRIREKTALSQPAFARITGVSVSTLRQWEQKRRKPEGPARVLLALVDRNPLIVIETLGRAA